MTKLPVREKISYATGDFASCLIWQSISIYVLYYFTNVAGIDTAKAVSILSISKLIDGVSDVLMGFIVDRTHSRFGKVRPYLLTMGLPLGFSTVMLFSIPAAFSVSAKLIWIFVWYNLVTTVFYTALNVPYSSMHCFLTEDSDERSKLSILRLIFAFGAQIIINASVFSLVRKLGGSVTNQSGWTSTMIIVGTAAFLFALLTFFGTKEHVHQDSAQNSQKVPVRDSIGSIVRNKYLLIILAATLCSYIAGALISGSSAYYAQFILKTVDATALITNATTGAMVVSLIFWVPFLIKHLKKTMIYRIGIAALVVCYLSSCIAPANLTVLLILNAIKGFAQGMTGPMLYAMCADAIDYGEWKTGISSAGLGTATLQCLGKFGMGLGTAVLGVILNLGGFVSTAAEQTAGGRSALVASYTWVPGIFMLMTFIIIGFYTLDKQYDRIHEELVQRRQSKANR